MKKQYFVGDCEEGRFLLEGLYYYLQPSEMPLGTSPMAHSISYSYLRRDIDEHLKKCKICKEIKLPRTPLRNHRRKNDCNK